jgi:uncharacterized membrane protein HdeD (DUF308 family)
MFDSKTSCLLRGIVGVIFGFLALMLPDITIITFRTLFWLLLILGIVILIFLAITAKGDESMLWFGLAAGLLSVGLLLIFVADFITLLFILIIAAIAVYNGFTDITLALMHPKTKYVLIPAMIITGFALLGILFYYFPGFEKNLFLSIVGTFALAFGLFSIMLGFYKSEGVGEGDETSLQKTAYTSNKSGRK